MAESNGRTTMALLGQKLDAVIEAQKDQKRVHEELMKMVAQNRQDVALNRQNIDGVREDVAKLATATNTAIDNLNNKFTAFSGVNSVIGLLATTLAIIFGVNK